MKKEPASPAQMLTQLRKKVEDIPSQESEDFGKLSESQISNMVHELHTHRIELELQNEELRQAWEELAVSRDLYTDLYDRAPVGYLTITAKGIIEKANLTAAEMLNTPRKFLLGQRLTDFIVSDDQDIYYRCRSSLLKKKVKQCCEVRIQRKGGEIFWARLDDILIENPGEDVSIRTVLNDINNEKQAVLALHQAHDELEVKVQQRTLELAKANVSLQDEILEHKRVSCAVEGYAQRQEIINNLLQLSLENLSLEERLSRCIEKIITFPGLGLKPSGIIFLRKKGWQELTLTAHSNISAPLLQACSRRGVGECLCGQAALQKRVVFSSWQDNCHEIIYQNMRPHGHYCVPIMVSGNVLGVLTLFTEEDALRNPVIEENLIASSNVLAGIIERATAKYSLDKRNELLSSIYATADSVALVTTDLEQDPPRITSFSPGAERIFGYTRNEVIGQPISLLNAPKQKHLLSGTLKRLKRGRKLSFPDTFLVRKSGEPFAATLTVHPLSNGRGSIIGTLGICMDISHLKMIQAELQRSNEELEKRVEERTIELQESQQHVLHTEKLAAIGRLSASIAHEFNNPMQGIVSVLSGIAKRAVLEKEDVDLLHSALNECKRITQLVRSLQDFNRPSSGKKEPVDLQKATETLLLLCKNDCKNRNINIVTDFGKDIPYVMAVSDQIKQVILNLLTNAADACPGGGTIYISTRPDGDAVRMEIRDTGVGISPDNISQIFEPFFSTKPEVKGTGLGLSVSYGIIKNHNGSLEVKSEPGKGATFTIILPARGC